MEIKIFESEIIDLIIKEDRLLSDPPSSYYLRYTRARYEQARADLIAFKKIALLNQGKDLSKIKIPTQNSPNFVPGWGWE